MRQADEEEDEPDFGFNPPKGSGWDSVLLLDTIMELEDSDSERYQGLQTLKETQTVQLFQLTKNIFKSLIPSDIIPSTFIDDIYTAFLAQIMEAVEKSEEDIIEILGSVPEKTFQKLTSGLSNCATDDGNSKWEVVYGGCPRNIVNITKSRNEQSASVSELMEKVPKDFMYVPDEEGFVPALMWKMIEAVHSKCYGVLAETGGILPNYYWAHLEMIFHNGVIQEKLYPGDKTGTSVYDGIIEGDRSLAELAVLVDTLVVIEHGKSKFQKFFGKPKKTTEGTKKSKAGMETR
jgi:hypothetical protein